MDNKGKERREKGEEKERRRERRENCLCKARILVKLYFGVSNRIACNEKNLRYFLATFQ